MFSCFQFWFFNVGWIFLFEGLVQYSLPISYFATNQIKLTITTINHHHQVIVTAWSSLNLSHHPSLSLITSSVYTELMYVNLYRLTNVCAPMRRRGHCLWVPSLLLLQCRPACLTSWFMRLYVDGCTAAVLWDVVSWIWYINLYLSA